MNNSSYHSTITAPVIDQALARNNLRWIPQETLMVELAAYLAGKGHKLAWDRTRRRLITTPIQTPTP